MFLVLSVLMIRIIGGLEVCVVIGLCLCCMFLLRCVIWVESVWVVVLMCLIGMGCD